MKSYKYFTDGTALNQGVCLKYEQGRIQKRSDPVQCRDKGWKSGKEKVVYRHSHPQE